jgi:ketosteroid isomerase-like protein
MPGIAQQLSEQEVRPAIEKLLAAWDAAADKKDATAIATMYTEDAMRVTPRGVPIWAAGY